MDIDDILMALTTLEEGHFPRAALEAAIAQREAITPELLRVLEETRQDELERMLAEPDYMLPFYALYLLARITPSSKTPSPTWNGGPASNPRPSRVATSSILPERPSHRRKSAATNLAPVGAAKSINNAAVKRCEMRIAAPPIPGSGSFRAGDVPAVLSGITG